MRTRYYVVRGRDYWDLATGWTPIVRRPDLYRCTATFLPLALACLGYHDGTRLVTVYDRFG